MKDISRENDEAYYAFMIATLQSQELAVLLIAQADALMAKQVKAGRLDEDTARQLGEVTSILGEWHAKVANGLDRALMDLLHLEKMEQFKINSDPERRAEVERMSAELAADFPQRAAVYREAARRFAECVDKGWDIIRARRRRNAQELCAAGRATGATSPN